MAKGSEIIVTSPERGVRLEGLLTSAQNRQVGTICQLKASTEPVGGRHTYERFQPGANGNRRPIYVVLNDTLRGMGPTQYYTAGDRLLLYVPRPGEELNIYTNAGTYAIGDLLMLVNASGALTATSGTPESEPFMCMETLTLSDAGLLHVMYTGY